jgi:DNA polymerase-3 subunit delta
MARIAAGELFDRLAKGKPVGAVLLLGDEAYLRDTCRAQLIEKMVPEAARAWAVSRYSADRGETHAALAQAQTLPMLSPRQVVFLENVEAIENLGDKPRENVVKAMEAYLDNPAPFTTLVFEAAGLDQRMKLGKLLAEKTLVVETGFGENDEAKRASAVALALKMANEEGVSFEPGVAEELSELVADDLMQLKTELQKLATFTGERRRVRREDVAALVVSNRKNTVWEMGDMIAAREGKAALEFLDQLLRDGEEPVRLVGAMAWMYRKLIEASELKGPLNGWQAAQQLHMNAKAAEQAIQSARKIPKERLLDGLRALQECDNRLKGGSGQTRAAMEFLIARLTGQNKSAEVI